MPSPGVKGCVDIGGRGGLGDHGLQGIPSGSGEAFRASSSAEFISSADPAWGLLVGRRTHPARWAPSAGTADAAVTLEIRKLEQDLGGEFLARPPAETNTPCGSPVSARRSWPPRRRVQTGPVVIPPDHATSRRSSPRPSRDSPRAWANGESGRSPCAGREVRITGGGVPHPRRGARSRADGRTRRRVRPGGRGCGTSWERPRGPSSSRRRERSPRDRSRGRV